MIHLLATVLAVRSMTVQTDMGCQVIAKNLLPFFFLSFFLSLYQSISLSTTLSLNLSLPPSLSLSLSISVSLSLSGSLTLSLSLFSIYLSLSLSLSQSLSLLLSYSYSHAHSHSLEISQNQVSASHYITLQHTVLQFITPHRDQRRLWVQHSDDNCLSRYSVLLCTRTVCRVTNI